MKRHTAKVAVRRQARAILLGLGVCVEGDVGVFVMRVLFSSEATVSSPSSRLVSLSLSEAIVASVVAETEDEPKKVG